MKTHGQPPIASDNSDIDIPPWRTPIGGVVTWLVLVAVAVVGRGWQPTWDGEPLWHATPLFAVALAAGHVFQNSAVAATVPLVALGLGNLVLPGYGNVAIAVVVYAAVAWPVLLGACGLLGRGRHRWPAVIGGSLASSLVFFVSTNLAHWAFTADYPHTGAGLVACFAAALPFYRWMPLGDVAWTAVVFGLLATAWSAADSSSSRRLHPHPVSPPTLD